MIELKRGCKFTSYEYRSGRPLEVTTLEIIDIINQSARFFKATSKAMLNFFNFSCKIEFEKKFWKTYAAFSENEE